MVVAALSLTHLGIVLLYAGSSSPPPVAGEAIGTLLPVELLRGIGGGALGAGLVLAVHGGPTGEGVLIWLSMAMASCSFVVITGPLAHRLLSVTALLALVTAAMAPWV